MCRGLDGVWLSERSVWFSQPLTSYWNVLILATILQHRLVKREVNEYVIKLSYPLSPTVAWENLQVDSLTGFTWASPPNTVFVCFCHVIAWVCVGPITNLWLFRRTACDKMGVLWPCALHHSLMSVSVYPKAQYVTSGLWVTSTFKALARLSKEGSGTTHR